MAAVTAAELETIGAVARRTGLPVKTIRFYSDEGLIRPAGRSEGGYRLFDPQVYEELRLIRTLKGMDIPLLDVRQLLDARRSGVCSCEELRARIAAKAEEVEERIAGLRSLQMELGRLLQSWQHCGLPRA